MSHNPYQSAAADSPKAAAERLLTVYDLACKAAIAKDADTIHHALALLRSTLDPSACPELALSLLQVYRGIEHALQQEDFATASRMLEETRGLWRARLKLDQIADPENRSPADR